MEIQRPILMSETLGERLRQTRQERNLSLEQVAGGTHIRLHYLEALEQGDLSRLPSKAQARGFVRAYAGYLGIDASDLLGLMDDEGREPAPLAEEPAPEPPEPVAVEPGGSRAIFRQLGEELRHHRETLGFSLEEVERNTRLRIHYLAALEDGELDSLPSPVQGRGMLQNYATFLGLDPEPQLLRFADGLQARRVEKHSAAPALGIARPPRRSRSPGGLGDRKIGRGSFRRWIPLDYILIGFVVVLLGAFIVWGVLRINSIRAEEVPEVTVPSVAEALLATSEDGVTLTPTLAGSTPTDSAPAGTAEETPAGTPEEPGTINTQEITPELALETPLPAISDAPVQVYVTVLQRAWMRATVDGEIEFEGRVLPGSAYTFAGTTQVELLTGNGAALQVFFGQEDIGLLGVYGEVVDRIFSPEGLVLPTPTITPTPSPTLGVTGTEQVTGTTQPTSAP